MFILIDKHNNTHSSVLYSNQLLVIDSIESGKRSSRITLLNEQKTKPYLVEHT